MTRLFLAFVLALSLAVPAFAKEVLLGGCTSDGQVVLSVVDLNDDALASHPVEEHVLAAYFNAAAKLTAAEFREAAGFTAFVEGLDESDVAAITSVTQPEVAGTCK